MSSFEKSFTQSRVVKYILCGFALVASVAFVFWNLRQSSRRNVPKELLGVWSTSEVAHQDRFLEISPVTVTFGTGGSTESTGFIQECDQVSEGAELRYTITYEGEDGKSKLIAYYNPSTQTLHLKNQQAIVWHKI